MGFLLGKVLHPSASFHLRVSTGVVDQSELTAEIGVAIVRRNNVSPDDPICFPLESRSSGEVVGRQRSVYGRRESVLVSTQ